MKAPLLVVLAALVAVLTAVLVRQGRRAAAEAELWAEATDPLPRPAGQQPSPGVAGGR